MEARALVITVALSLIASMPEAVFAYSRDTHMGITQAIVHSYEQLHGDTFSSGEEQAVIKGSSDEDDSSRPLQHFYDPVNNRGLSKLFQEFESSKYWSQDTEAQGNYSCIGSVLCTGDSIGYNDKLFSSDTDFSWDRGVYEYVWGDKKRGVETLGHILHLVEDATVPAHVRNDDHLSGFDPDPYEAYTSRFGLGSVPVPSRSGTTPKFPGVAFALDGAAVFTNKHFLSKDSVLNYKFPDIESLPSAGSYVYDSASQSKIAKVEKVFNRRANTFTLDTLVDDPLVLQDYWNALSKEAIRNGIGVIDLFFRSAEEEKRTHELQKKNVSAAELHAKELALKGFNTVKALYGSSLSQEDVAELLGDNQGQAGAAALAVADPRQGEPAAPMPPDPGVEPEAPKQDPVPPPIEDAPSLPEAAPVVPEEPKLQPGPAPTSYSPGFGGGGASPAPASASQPQDNPIEVSLTITSPLDDVVLGTTSVTFIGTTIRSGFVTASFDSSSASTSAADGDWSLSLEVPEGATHIVFTATDNSGRYSTTTARDISVDLTPTDTASIAVAACEHSLISSGCLIATTTALVAWNDVADAASYAVVTNGIVGAAMTATSSLVSIDTAATTSIAVVTYDIAGNAATSSSVFVRAVLQPLIINEIAWGGTDTAAGDQWIEIKNTSLYTLDLSHVSISRSGGPPIQLTGTIGNGSEGFLLVEPHDISFTGSRKIIVPFDSLSTVAGEQLALTWDDGVSETTLDVTPAVGTCSSWCAGALAAAMGTNTQGLGDTVSPLSMERKPDTADGTMSSSWQSSDGYGRWERSDNVSASWGTPTAESSEGYPAAGWTCDSTLGPVAENGSYNPGTGDCLFLMRFISPSVNRMGAVYRGDVASSTNLIKEGFSKRLIASSHINMPVDAQPGEHFFTAIWEQMPPGDLAAAYDFIYNFYFTQGASSTQGVTGLPGTAYVVIPWTYAP